MQTSFEDPDGNSFNLVGYDTATREFEAQRRAVEELDIARQVQSRLFPQKLIALKTLEYSGLCLQARSVGGDYYDFIPTGPDRLALVVADIAGKGIAAALVMASLHACLRSQTTIVLGDSGELLRSVNQFLCQNTSESVYATLFFAEYSDKLSRLRYANCGHPPALLLRSDNNLERLSSNCPAVGLLQEWDCSVQECQLFPGDIFVLYTDGVIESVDRQGTEFGEQRLADALRRHRLLSPQDLISAIADEIREFNPREQADDITVVVAKCS
jgi:serine phosphatase RsbU (regulator of sigma subunit)